MRQKQTAGAMLVGVLVLGLAALVSSGITAQSPSPAALTGTVTSQAEGPMEGVVVIARRQGSTILTSVTTNASGQYSFPRSHMAAGAYTIMIRAAGFVLEGAETVSVEVGASTSARRDLRLATASKDQFAHQLTNVDWWTSIPGTPAQKDMLVRSIMNCGFCHEMERVMRSAYTADRFLPVLQRMDTYAPDNTSACGTGSTLACDARTRGRMQVSSRPGPPESFRWQSTVPKALAQYLASINLSGGKTTWDFPLKAMPRPKGKATRAIVTVYPIPRQPSVIHDLDVDSKGNVWYGDNGWGYLGKLDPRTATFTEYPAPNYRPEPTNGLPRVVGVHDVRVDTNDRIWAGLGGSKMVYFDPATEKWTDFDMPGNVWAYLPSIYKGQTVWTTTGSYGPVKGPPLTAHRLNIKTRQVEASFPVMVDSAGKDQSGPKPVTAYGQSGMAAQFCYQIERDLDDNFLCADYYGSNIVTVNGKTGASKAYPTPTPNAAPRRGRVDAQGRFWFGEFWGDRLGMFDPRTGSIREFPYSTKYMSAYAAVGDRRGHGWGSSHGSDRVVRANPATGETTEYLMPVYYDARSIAVDLSATTTTIWLPNKNLAQLIRIEVPD